MNYKYIPDTYDYGKIVNKFGQKELFEKCQIEYRKKFELYLRKYINIEELNNNIYNCKVDIPRIKDEHYNFYHHDSNLNNSYIYLRNNIHVENLTLEEIKYILTNDDINDSFFYNTYEKVLFEDGKESFFGMPQDETIANSNTLVFEFAYNQLECKSLDQINKISELINNCNNIIRKYLVTNLNIEPSFIIYKANPDLFYDEDIKIK